MPLSVSSRAVNVRAVLDCDDVDPSAWFVDAVDDVEVAAACTVKSREIALQRLAYPLRMIGRAP
ncbi:MAG: hypothetical protein WKF82_10475 [Nocardioidaceae bacterium]